ncbi:hypothetical protein HanXRQr2_Chr03g0090131 [Helianthus annuus]|uniref:Uncharacterized protein n=1 Tax=Helianthus annuus TaxID=4232 RepID=A0A251UWA3_HELAN|nr:uncharacterized protein LOC110935619 [Helianthus annuus]KAF5812753.1 hypothetical protein HanXRQr2_Chr03g0090131 [Helianthus annuus]KAJ0606568.1 hypothetical protein HanHA89_Chr03g0086611 [Helianthus annuus]
MTSSSIFASNGMVLATAMAAVSGTVILLAFRRQKPPSTAAASVAGSAKFSSTHQPRPCISIDGKKKKVKKRKKVHFAEDVMEPSGSGEEFRKRLERKSFQKLRVSSSLFKDEGGKRKINMPANRIALYTGILRDRSVHRFAYA